MMDHLKSGISVGRAVLAHGATRRYGGFLLGGGLAFLTDAAVLLMLTRGAGLSPFSARPLSICVAMVVSWLINRTITFAQTVPPTFAEFGRFAAVAWTAQAVNYGVFAAILLAVPGLEPLIALALACLVSMIVSFNGYKHGVFRRRSH